MRVLLVEDHPAVREGLTLVLGKKGIVVAACADGVAGALAALASLDGCDAAIVDLSLEQGSGLELLRTLREKRPLLPLIVYSMYEERKQVRGALDAGASGYVTKRDAVEFLVEGVLAVAAGKTFLSPRASRSLEAPAAAKDLPGALPPQESRVFQLLGEGFGINEMAEKLDLSARTIET